MESIFTEFIYHFGFPLQYSARTNYFSLSSAIPCSHFFLLIIPLLLSLSKIMIGLVCYNQKKLKASIMIGIHLEWVIRWNYELSQNDCCKGTG